MVVDELAHSAPSSSPCLHQPSPSPRLLAAVDREFKREMDAERREARRSARLRCRARVLLEAGEAALAALPAEAAESPLTDPIIRPMSALELGLMYAWMAADERECAEAEEHVTRWWSGGATGIQQTWEKASGWFDEELDEEPSSTSVSGRGPRPAVASSEALTTAVSTSDRSVIGRQLGTAAVRDTHAPPRRGPHLLGAFVSGRRAPVGFAATHEPTRKEPAHSAWLIDAMGTRLEARGRGIGTALATHCIEAAKAADAEQYRIDVVPTAVGFWERLGFEAAEPSAEQSYWLKRGGDRPMVKRLVRAETSLRSAG